MSDPSEWNLTVRSIAPEQFGPHWWYMLHSLALRMPDAKDHSEAAEGRRRAFIAYVSNLPHALPCQSCTHHCQNMINGEDIEAAAVSHQTASALILRMHNQVNERLGRPAKTANDVYALVLGPSAPAPVESVDSHMCAMDAPCTTHIEVAQRSSATSETTTQSATEDAWTPYLISIIVLISIVLVLVVSIVYLSVHMESEESEGSEENRGSQLIRWERGDRPLKNRA
jgi:hypothetical protein